MEWNIAAESISLIMLGIIWLYARKGSHLPSLKNRCFQGCLVVTYGAMQSNILSTLMIERCQVFPLWMTWGVTTIYFVLTPLMGMMYYLYTVSVIYTDIEEAKRVIVPGIVPAALYACLVAANLVNGKLFRLNMADGYQRGDWISSTYIVFYLYCLMSIMLTVYKRKEVEKEIGRILTVFPILAVLVIFFQQMYPTIILSGSAATCALLIIYLHLQNKQISLDYLTSLPNRQELLNMMEILMKKTPEKQFVLLSVSLRDFRQVNNACGQQKGDIFLKKIAQFLGTVGPQDNVYRFGGDEFALLFLQQKKGMTAECIEKIQQRMTQFWYVDEYCFTIPAVMGAVYHNSKDDTVEKVVNSIEYAVAQAKTGKYGQVCYCDKTMQEKLERRRKIIQILHSQLENPEFEMYYQPIYSVKSGRFLSAESLMRIPHSPIGPIYPSEFIPLAEETGLIIELTYIMLDKVCRFINRLLEAKVEVGVVHVNFSGSQFSQAHLVDRMQEIMQRNHTPMSLIEIEFTESTLAESPQVVTEFAMKMLERGVRMSLDDFGTGYSNIATVINIPFGTVKLDRSLVVAAMESEESALAIQGLTNTFKALHMNVLAEGVETEEQNQLVAEFGVDQIQGFYFARPMPEDEAVEFMSEKEQKYMRDKKV